MGSILSIVIAIVVTAIAAGLVGYAIYFTVTNKPPAPAPGPTGLPQGQTMNMFFKNERTVPIWIMPTYVTTTDNHVPRWTNWPFVSGNTGPVVGPHTPDLQPTEIQPGDTAEMSIYTAGMASVKFSVRVNCHEPSKICDLGDSTPFPGFDSPANDPFNYYRGNVPFKPPIDTLVEMTWGCAYEDQSLCGSNPSCISDPGSCVGMQNLMDTHTGAVWHSDGLLYGPDGKNIKLPLTNPPDPTSPGVGALERKTYFDISCVNGYTVPITMMVRRPPTSKGHSNTRCRVNYSQTAPAIDVDTDDGWQTIASTASIKIADCPTNEILWPTQLNTITAMAGSSPPNDGFNTGTEIGQVQYPMPWLTQAMTGGSPTGSPPVKLIAAFTTGVTTDLTYYRDPQEIAAVPSAGYTINDKIGCASTCSSLTQNRGVSMLYPTPNGHTGHHFATGTYLVDSVHDPLVPLDRGVSDICCVAAATGTIITQQKPLAFNTSIYWHGNGATGPVQTGDIVANYAFGYFANVYAPDDSSPWYVAGPTGPLSRNPYTGVGDMSKYTLTIRTGATGQYTKTRAYSYVYDDPYSTVLCDSAASENLKTSNGRGAFYGQYQVMMVVHDGL